MRDRFISVATSREPEPPTFRVVQNPDSIAPSVASIVSEEAPDLTSVSGVGPVYATRLEAVGISTLEDLASADASKVADAAGVPESRAADWIEQARSITT